MKTAMALGAHPDDIEIGCGGTLAKLSKAGYRLVFVLATSGEQGARSGRGEDISRLREREARRAAEALGCGQVIFLREPDGLSSYSPAAKLRLIASLREFRPDRFFLHASSDSFPDHRVVRELGLASLAGAAGPWYPEAPADPHRVAEVLGYEVWNPMPVSQLTVDISDTLGHKLAALACHESQLATVDYARAVTGLAAYRGVMGMAGAHAEAFEVFQTELKA